MGKAPTSVVGAFVVVSTLTVVRVAVFVGWVGVWVNGQKGS
ncbi:hypothetical protein [Phycicoccus sonneratiae]|nr:hypothetical protein [Phycicoccus sonneraticus]